MKKTLLALALGVCPIAASANLLITGVYDGPITGGVPKGVEITVTEAVDDLSVFGLGSANNGGGSDGEEFTFPALAASAGDVIYVASEAVQFEAFFGFAPHHTSSAMSINGDDAIELFRNGELWDVYGVQSVDGTGAEWDYQDGWAYRASGSSASVEFNASQWVFSGANALDGESTNASASTPMPIGQFDVVGSGNGGDNGGDNGNGGGEPPVVNVVTISSIQGNPSTYASNQYGEDDVSPLNGELVTVEAVVVGDFQNNDEDSSRDLGGFYLQEEVTDEDGDALSSEGVFVFNPGTTMDVQLGDLVRVTATVGQYYGETQLTNVEAIEVIASDQLHLVQPAEISLLSGQDVSMNQNGRYQPNLEAYEGMWVTLVDELQVIEQFQLDRFNEVRLAAGLRPVQFSQVNTPDAMLYDLWLQEQGARSIVYDDGLNTQNQSINHLHGFTLDSAAGDHYGTSNAPRMGDTTTGLSGVLDYKWAGSSTSGATWRVRANENDRNMFIQSNPRPEAAPVVGGNLTVTSFNVLNFFATLDESGVTTAAGHDPRGADSVEEYERQLAKLVNAMVALDADVLGLVELENHFDGANDGSTAIEQLVNAVNDRLGSGVYDYVYPGSEFVGTDAIAVGFIYKPAVVQITEGTEPAQLDDAVAQTLPEFSDRDFEANPIFNGIATNRVSLAVSFTHAETQESFTVVANHFKSKGPSGLADPSDANFDKNDGAGYWNQRRLDAATAVAAWLATSPTGLVDEDQIILGDLNAYAAEEPVEYLLSNGFNNVEQSSTEAGVVYSYVYDGQVGTLDYLLVSDSLAEKLVGAEVWHINADEADAIDYNLDYGRSAEYYSPLTAARNSDHDPVIAGFEFAQSAMTVAELSAMFVQQVQDNTITPLRPSRWFSWFSVYSIHHSLKVAVAMEQRGRTEAVCALLAKVDRVTDGERRPRDWVKGSGVEAFNAQLNVTFHSLNCH